MYLEQTLAHSERIKYLLNKIVNVPACCLRLAKLCSKGTNASALNESITEDVFYPLQMQTCKCSHANAGVQMQVCKCSR